MSIDLKLRCDQCARPGPVTQTDGVAPGGTIELLRRAAREEGWTRHRRKASDTRDLCPACAAVWAPKRKAVKS